MTCDVTITGISDAGFIVSDVYAYFDLGAGAPIAVFTFTPDPAAPGEAVTFDASLSSGLVGRVVDYHWNFGDGTTTVDTPMSYLSHTYSCTGTATATLTVTDESGQTGRTSKQLRLTPKAGLRPCSPLAAPAASFTANPATALPEQTVSFDGSGSSDPSGPISNYHWDFGDGTPTETPRPRRSPTRISAQARCL